MVPDVGCEGQSVLNCTVTKNLKRLVVLTFNLKTIPVISDINDVYHKKKLITWCFQIKRLSKICCQQNWLQRENIVKPV